MWPGCVLLPEIAVRNPGTLAAWARTFFEWAFPFLTGAAFLISVRVVVTWKCPRPFPPVRARVEIVVRTQTLNCAVQGVVQSVHKGFGMGVQLVSKPPNITTTCKP